MQYSAIEEITVDQNAVYVDQSNINSAYELQTYSKELTLFEVVNLDLLKADNNGVTLKVTAYDKVGILFILQNNDGEVLFPKLTDEEQKLLQDQSKYVLGLEDKGIKYWFAAYLASRDQSGKLKLEVPITVGEDESIYEITIEVGDTSKADAIDLVSEPPIEVLETVVESSGSENTERRSAIRSAPKEPNVIWPIIRT